MTKKKFYFSIKDLMLIALITAVATGSKTVIGIIVRSFTGAIGIPGGAIAGGLYMLWLPLVLVITKKRGSAFLLCFLQAIVMLVTSLAGSHGFWNFVTYVVPGIMVELVYFIKKSAWDNILVMMLAVVLANVAGTVGSNFLFFKLSAIPFLFMIVAAIFSAIVGSFVGKGIAVLLQKQGLLKEVDSGNTNGTEDEDDDEFFEAEKSDGEIINNISIENPNAEDVDNSENSDENKIPLE